MSSGNYKSITDISQILESYVDDISEQITASAENIANEGKSMLQNSTSTYKVRTGKYNKGWRVSKTRKSNYINCTIHNATDYQLTHLLENGHAVKNKYGSYGMTRGFTHIAPVNDYCVEKFESDVTNIIKKGGK